MREDDDPEDDEPFEIKDFSVATPWEAWICAAEEAVRSWLSHASTTQHTVAHEGGHVYALHLYGDPTARQGASGLPRFMDELMDSACDFTSTAFSLDCHDRIHRWFGLNAFIVLAPTDAESLDEHEMSLMQGALNVVLLSCNCHHIPCFVLHELGSTDLYGRASAHTPAVGCRFDVELKSSASVPERCLSPAGLIALFRSKLCAADAAHATDSGGGAEPPELTVARRHTFVLGEWPRWSPPQVGPVDFPLDVGTPRDPLPQLALSAQWPCTAVRAMEWDDRPADAPLWLLRPLADRSRPHLLGGGAPATAIAACLRSLLDGWMACESAANARGSWDGLLQTMAASGCRLLAPHEVQATTATIMRQSAHAGERAARATRAPEGAPSSARSFECSGAERGGLLHRLGLAALHARSRGARSVHVACALLQLWEAVLARVRDHVDRTEPLPHISGRPPVSGSALVQQQVQLIALCVARKRAEVGRAESSARTQAAEQPAEEADDGDDDVFEECAPPPDGDAAGEPDDSLQSETMHQHVPTLRARVGAHRPLPGLYGVRSGLQLWEPHVQEAVPLTDEMAHAASESPMAVHASARLKSDMQAFKAANPGAVLADFVRWRSPEDWAPQAACMEDAEADGSGRAAEREPDSAAPTTPSEEPQEASSSCTPAAPSHMAHLSARMRAHDGLWNLLWRATLPIPTAEQRPLFNADRQALEALDQLDSLSTELLLPQLVYLAIEASLAAMADSPLIGLAGTHAMSTLIAVGESARHLLDRGEAPQEWMASLLDRIGKVEAALQRAASLAAKLPEPQLVASLLTDNDEMIREVVVTPKARLALHQRLKLADTLRASPEPDVKEYILRARAARSHAAGAVPTAQRMYVALQDEQFRLAVALSSDFHAV